MVAPFLVGGMIASNLITGAMQWYQSEKAAGASADRLNEIRALIEQVREPNFDPASVPPEVYKLVGKYNPQLETFVGEVAPTLLQGKSEAAKEGLAAQRAALSQLKQQSVGRDLEADVMMGQAQRDSAIAARGAQQSALREMEGTGRAGSALEAALIGGQQQITRGSQMSQNAAIDANRRRLQAIKDAASLGQNIRGQELDIEQTNMGAINRFNEMNTKARRDYGSRTADTMNEAQLKNLGAEQDISNKNVATTNTFRQNEQQRSDDIKQKEFDNKMRKISGLSGVAGQQNDVTMTTAGQRNTAMSGVNDAVQSGLSYAYDKATEEEKDTPLKRTYV